MKLSYSALKLILLFCTITNTAGLSQQIGVNTDEIESVIDEWNFANNSRNLHSFDRVYANRVTFYTKEVTKRKAIALKQQLFKEKPYFRQRIVTEISYKPYSTGVVKCDFTREVFEKTRWKKYRTYLLVSYANRHYTIVGESDYPTDEAKRYKPSIGDPITFDKSPVTVDTSGSETFRADTFNADTFTDTAIAADVDADTSSFVTAPPLAADTTQAILNVEDQPSVFSDLSSMGVVIIPKGYLFMLVGILGLGGLMIFIADSVQSRKRRQERFIHKHDEAEHVVRDFKMQAGFESFVVTLFDPKYFRHRRPKTQHVYAGKSMEAEKGPDLEFDFIQKETHVRFAIKCQYYKHVAKNEVQLFTPEHQHHFRQFEEDREMDVYYVLGFGGRPDDPQELFFLPAKAVKSEYINKATLRQYSKSGMFFYNRKSGMIQ